MENFENFNDDEQVVLNKIVKDVKDLADAAKRNYDDKQKAYEALKKPSEDIIDSDCVDDLIEALKEAQRQRDDALAKLDIERTSGIKKDKIITEYAEKLANYWTFIKALSESIASATKYM